MRGAVMWSRKKALPAWIKKLFALLLFNTNLPCYQWVHLYVPLCAASVFKLIFQNTLKNFRSENKQQLWYGSCQGIVAMQDNVRKLLPFWRVGGDSMPTMNYNMFESDQGAGLISCHLSTIAIKWWHKITHKIHHWNTWNCLLSKHHRLLSTQVLLVHVKLSWQLSELNWKLQNSY